MKKLFNVAIAFCVILLFSATVYAAEIAPYSLVGACPSCITGQIIRSTSSVYQHDESFPCSHGKKGQDLYGVYEVTVRNQCDSCSYTNNYTYENHVLKACKGR